MGTEFAEPEADLEVEEVQPRHAAALASLFGRNRHSVVAATFTPFALTTAQAHHIALEPRADEYYLAVRAGEILAMSMLRGFDEGYTVPSFGIFVDHDHHGEGIGRFLTSWTLEEARRKGCPAVRLSVYASNLHAIYLYESLGFSERSRETVVRDTGSDERIVMTILFPGA